MRIAKLEAAWLGVFRQNSSAENLFLEGAVFCCLNWDGLLRKISLHCPKSPGPSTRLSRGWHVWLALAPQSRQGRPSHSSTKSFMKIWDSKKQLQWNSPFRISTLTRLEKNLFVTFVVLLKTCFFFIAIQALVTKKGSQCLLSLIYWEVARKLGITCEIVLFSPGGGNTDNEMFIRWMEYPE